MNGVVVNGGDRPAVSVQVARGETPYKQFKEEFVDTGGRRAEMEARAVIEQMDGQRDGASSGSESEMQHTVEVTEVRPLPPGVRSRQSWLSLQRVWLWWPR